MADSDRAPHGDTCQVCPVCLLLGGGLAARPEVREHLRAAGRELAMALRAALDGAGEGGDAPSDLRRIDLEDG